MINLILMLLNLFFILALCAGIAYLVKRWSFSPKRHSKLLHRYSDINVTVNSGAIVLLSLGLAFIFGDISNVRSRAKLAVLQEADAMRTIGRTSLNLDPTIGGPLMIATREYATAVVEKEWPQLSLGRPDHIRSGQHSALTPLTVMSDIVYAPENLTKLPNATSMQLTILVSRIREQRLTRIDTSSFSIGVRSALLALITTLASCVIISLVNLRKPRAQFLSNFILFGVTASTLYLAFIAQNPFAGPDAVSNAPIHEALDRLNNMRLTRTK
jgi:hypothetical protein